MKQSPLMLLLGLALAATAHAGSIRLRTAATIEPDRAVCLRDVALLEGDDAEGLGGLVLVDDPTKRAPGKAWITLTIIDVKQALSESGARMSAISLSGSSCSVRFGEAAAKVMEAPRIEKAEPGPVSIDISGPPTVRKHAAAALAALHGVDISDLRLLFDEDDSDFLDEIRFGVRVVVQPQTTPGSARSVLTCRVFDGDRMLENRTIRADVEIRRRAVVLQQSVRRRDEIPAAALLEQEMWVAASQGRPIESVGDVAGSLARTRLETGTVLRAELLESPVIVRRNELVSIHAVRGGFEVQSKARARADARRGEVITFRAEGSKNEFTARVERPGMAVVNLDGDGQGSEQE